MLSGVRYAPVTDERSTDDAADAPGVEYGLEEWGRDEGTVGVTEPVDGSAGSTSSFRDRTGPGSDATKSVVAGAVAAFVVSRFLPVIGVGIGGAIAGNLHGEGKWPGAKLGAAAGLLQAIPDLVLGLVFGIGGFSGLLFPVLTGQTTGVEAIMALVFATLFGGVVLVFAVVAGAVGGYLGGSASRIEVGNPGRRR